MSDTMERIKNVTAELLKIDVSLVKEVTEPYIPSGGRALGGGNNGYPPFVDFNREGGRAAQLSPTLSWWDKLLSYLGIKPRLAPLQDEHDSVTTFYEKSPMARVSKIFPIMGPGEPNPSDDCDEDNPCVETTYHEAPVNTLTYTKNNVSKSGRISAMSQMRK